MIYYFTETNLAFGKPAYQSSTNARGTADRWDVCRKNNILNF